MSNSWIDFVPISIVALAVAFGERAYNCTDAGKFYGLYNEMILKYADVNRDGKVSESEKRGFDLQLIKDKDVIYMPHDTISHYVCGGMFLHDDSSEIPYDTLTKWLKDYDTREKNSVRNFEVTV